LKRRTRVLTIQIENRKQNQSVETKDRDPESLPQEFRTNKRKKLKIKDRLSKGGAKNQETLGERAPWLWVSLFKNPFSKLSPG